MSQTPSVPTPAPESACAHTHTLHVPGGLESYPEHGRADQSPGSLASVPSPLPLTSPLFTFIASGGITHLDSARLCHLLLELGKYPCLKL